MQTAAIILAAGKSTRMKSELPKVLHEVCGRPMLAYVLDACRGAGVDRLVVVVGHRKEEVIATFAGDRDIEWVAQTEQHGTGHAALMCEKALGGFEGPVLTIAGDMPLIRQETCERVLAEAKRTEHAVTLATAVLDDPAGYGRIVRDGAGRLAAIVEHNDCTPEERAIREVNISYYCFDGARLFNILHKIGNDNAKKEYYITDTVTIALREGLGAGAVPAVPAEDALGINSRADVALINRVMQGRIQKHWLDRAVTIVDPSTTWIEAGATIGEDTSIYPFSYIGSGASIGAGCRLGPHAFVMRGETVPAGKMVSPLAPTGA
ncbi:MAG: NTP transferase domain-containing protein [Phycisphaerales bacterium]|nr:NTP transferase domain-containing protein [Phycisphaerales bacterium]